MKSYTFDLTLLTSVKVNASSVNEGKTKIREMLEECQANIGSIDGDPVLVSLEIEGNIDLGHIGDI